MEKYAFFTFWLGGMLVVLCGHPVTIGGSYWLLVISTPLPNCRCNAVKICNFTPTKAYYSSVWLHKNAYLAGLKLAFILNFLGGEKRSIGECHRTTAEVPRVPKK